MKLRHRIPALCCAWLLLLPSLAHAGGVLTIHEVRKFVSWHWEQDELNAIVVGALLIIAVLANRLFSRSDR